MKKFKAIASLLLLISFVSSCSAVAIPKVQIVIPDRPLLLECPEKPFVEGEVIADTVVLPFDQAEALKKWIDGTSICKDSNILMLKGHIEKLENRLKAVTDAN